MLRLQIFTTSHESEKSILAVVQDADIPVLEALTLLLVHVHLRSLHVLRKHRVHDY